MPQSRRLVRLRGLTLFSYGRAHGPDHRLGFVRLREKYGGSGPWRQALRGANDVRNLEAIKFGGDRGGRMACEVCIEHGTVELDALELLERGLDGGRGDW